VGINLGITEYTCRWKQWHSQLTSASRQYDRLHCPVSPPSQNTRQFVLLRRQHSSPSCWSRMDCPFSVSPELLSNICHGMLLHPLMTMQSKMHIGNNYNQSPVFNSINTFPVIKAFCNNNDNYMLDAVRSCIRYTSTVVGKFFSELLHVKSFLEEQDFLPARWPSWCSTLNRQHLSIESLLTSHTILS